MLSKDWKYLVLAPLTICFLTACPSKKDPSVSNFTGVWMNDTALGAYRRHLDANKTLDVDGFCQEIDASNITLFGLMNDGSSDVVLDAVLVQVNGEVSRYSPEVRSNSMNPGYVDALRVGHVDNDGTYTTFPFNTRNYRSGMYFAGLDRSNDPRFRVAVTNSFFTKDGDDRFVKEGNRRSQGYFRTDDNEMRGYLNAVRQCPDYWNGGNGSYNNDGGGRRVGVVRHYQQVQQVTQQGPPPPRTVVPLPGGPGGPGPGPMIGPGPGNGPSGPGPMMGPGPGNGPGGPGPTGQGPSQDDQDYIVDRGAPGPQENYGPQAGGPAQGQGQQQDFPPYRGPEAQPPPTR